MAATLTFVAYRIRNLRRLMRARGITGTNQQIDQTWGEIADAAGVHPLYASALTIGETFSVTLEERELLKLNTIRPCDLTADEFGAYQKEQRRLADATRKRRDRAYKAQQRAVETETRAHAGDLDVRKEVIWSVLTRAFAIDELATILAMHPAFLHDGQRLPTKSLKRSIQRAVAALQADGRVERQERKSIRGTPLYLVRRTSSAVVPLRPTLLLADG